MSRFKVIGDLFLYFEVVSQEQINESLMSKKLTITWTDINVHATKSPNKFVQLKNLFTCQKGEGATRKQIINNGTSYESDSADMRKVSRKKAAFFV